MTNRTWINELLRKFDDNNYEFFEASSGKNTSLNQWNKSKKKIQESAKVTINQHINQEFEELLENLPEKLPNNCAHLGCRNKPQGDFNFCSEHLPKVNSTLREGLVRLANEHLGQLSTDIGKKVRSDFLDDVEILIQRKQLEASEKAYRKGYQAGNAQKNYQKVKELEKLKERTQVLDNLYNWLIARDDFDLRKQLPSELREEIGRLQTEALLTIAELTKELKEKSNYEMQ